MKTKKELLENVKYDLEEFLRRYKIGFYEVEQLEDNLICLIHKLKETKNQIGD